MKPLPVLLLITAGSIASVVQPYGTLSTEASHTTPWADTSKRGDTTFYSRGRVVSTVSIFTDSQWSVRPPVALGIPYGPFDLPLDTLCTLGYTGTTLAVVGTSVVRDLQRIHDCGTRTFAKIRRARLKDSAGHLSVAAAGAELATWPWTDVCNRIKDSTVIAVYIGDDITAEEWGPAPLATRLAQWDTIAGLVQARCPKAPVAIRGRPTQLEARSRWLWLTTAWAQYVARSRTQSPEQFFDAEVASARRQRLGLVAGLTLLNGGCGPADKGLCLPDVPGTSLPGTREDRYQMSAAELVYYKTVAMTDPYVCASVDWVWGPNVGSPFHDRPDIRSASKALGVLAKKRAGTSCVQR
jgi:hypothetical protein